MFNTCFKLSSKPTQDPGKILLSFFKITKLQTNSGSRQNLFKLVHLRTYPLLSKYWHLVVATETWTVGQMGGTHLLECCLVITVFKNHCKPNSLNKFQNNKCHVCLVWGGWCPPILFFYKIKEKNTRIHILIFRTILYVLQVQVDSLNK